MFCVALSEPHPQILIFGKSNDWQSYSMLKAAVEWVTSKEQVSLSNARRSERERDKAKRINSLLKGPLRYLHVPCFNYAHETQGKIDVRPLWNLVHSLRVRTVWNEVTLWCIETQDDFVHTFHMHSACKTSLKYAWLKIKLFRKLN